MKTSRLVILTLGLAIIALIGVLMALNNFAPLEGPFTPEQVRSTGLRVPLYSVDPSSTGYRTVHFTRNFGDFVQITTYFVDDAQPSTAVALITTYTVFSGFEAGQETVQIKWGAGEAAYVCDPSTGSSASVVPSMTVPDFRSCIYWMDSEGYFVRFQSIWTQDEAVDFINSLSAAATT
jgi:hypothetical protein